MGLLRLFLSEPRLRFLLTVLTMWELREQTSSRTLLKPSARLARSNLFYETGTFMPTRELCPLQWKAVAARMSLSLLGRGHCAILEKLRLVNGPPAFYQRRQTHHSFWMAHRAYCGRRYSAGCTTVNEPVRFG